MIDLYFLQHIKNQPDHIGHFLKNILGKNCQMKIGIELYRN
jgi:hypothetical protein